MGNNKAVILAAGRGSRMKSGSSKPMTNVCGKKLIQYSIDVLKASGIDDVTVVYSNFSEDVVELSSIYPKINLIKQENPTGSLSSFNFVGENVEPPFFLLDCDIIFTKKDFEKMTESIKPNDNAYAYFAVVTTPNDDAPKYIKIENGLITDFEKSGVPNGYSGGMIYYWKHFPKEEAKKFAKHSTSLAAFYKELTKQKNIKPMNIEQLWDIDTMVEVVKAENLLRGNDFDNSRGH